MVKEFIIASLLGIAALFIIIKNLKNSAQGKCNCGSCSSNCPMNNKNKENQKNSK
ncbi:FeoB-associated Cys-rich membrane protein [Clostridium brassicae]|uniref:FeoB-associated Cys-rich membrane protein n=1 Tax=Clostridium brassicae TaxID=2999072 RepID=A0ABT4DAI9_9CLOT|nr:FeoB-associated Cys-rich membrane protein [Clostridium brassicae]MCY6959307.1 FeoB-associated Cys-rich membrane protein [Clostridium brassicae]